MTLSGFDFVIPRGSHHGFTLVELLFTIVIIATIAALAFPGYKHVSESAKIAVNLSNLRNMPVLVTNIADNFLFADGHVGSLAPNELPFNHFALSYKTNPCFHSNRQSKRQIG
jgi:prepilin-type N-terminal cleavage/methylation domain-containing protein